MIQIIWKASVSHHIFQSEIKLLHYRGCPLGEYSLSHGIRSEKINNLTFITSPKNNFKSRALSPLLDQIHKIIKHRSLKMALLLRLRNPPQMEVNGESGAESPGFLNENQL